MNKFKLFGIELLSWGNPSDNSNKQNNNSQSNETPASFAPPPNDDGALLMPETPYYGQYVDLNGVAKTERELITKYREMANHPEVNSAIDSIVNEVIVSDQNGELIKINLDDVNLSPEVKEQIEAEFKNILKLYNYKNLAYDIYRKFYIDGRMYWHMIVDKEHPEKGIKEIRYIDSRKMKLVREARIVKDKDTGADMVMIPNEYYVYSKSGHDSKKSTVVNNASLNTLKIAKDSIVYFTSGLMDSKNGMVLGRLHKAIKPLNQLRMIEDAILIYRISRAPERRVFYVNVGGMSKPEAEKHLRDIMVKYKNKVVYNVETGLVGDERRFLSMQDDFWIPRRNEGDTATKIDQLPAGESLKSIDDVEYFEKRLAKSLDVPFSRLNSSDGFNLGRSTEISRDEVNYAKFIERERKRFEQLFIQPLRLQCSLKAICTKAEFDNFVNDIKFDFIKDNHYAELKEAELLTNRINVLTAIEPYRGEYFSKEYIFKNILRMNDSEIKTMLEQIEQDKKNNDDVPTATKNNARQQHMLNDVALQNNKATHDQQLQFQQQEAEIQAQQAIGQESQDNSQQQAQQQQEQPNGNNPSGSNMKSVEPKEVPSIKKTVSNDK